MVANGIIVLSLFVILVIFTIVVLKSDKNKEQK